MSEVLDPKIKEKETESQLVDGEDGELFIRMDDEADPTLKDEEGAGPEPEKGKTGKDKPETGSDGGAGKNAEIKAGKDYVFEGDDVPASYRGKSAAEVLEMHRSASDELVKKGQIIADYEKAKEELSLTPDQLRKRMSSKDLKALMSEENKKLGEINQDLDPETYRQQADIVDEIRTDFLLKSQDETLNARLNGEANETFKATHRKTLDDLGFELDDNQYKAVIEGAKPYASNGLLTPEAVQHALIDELGITIVTKNIAMKAAGKTRDEIKNAQKNTQPLLDLGGSGKSGHLINIDDLVADEEKFRATIDKLSPADLKKLRKRIEARADAGL